MRFIKGILPVFDFNQVDNTDDVIQIQNIKTMREKQSILIKMVIITNLKKK